MAVVTARDGQITIGALLGNVSSANISINASNAATKGIGETWDSFVTAGLGYTGSAECSFNSTDTAQTNLLSNLTSNSSTSDTGVSVATVGFKLKVASTIWLRGNALLGSLSIGETVNDKTSYSINFTGTGRLWKTTSGT